MDARAEQLVLDYLRLLGDAAQEKLRPEERQKFLARSRAAIARQVGETRAEQPREVQRLLRGFGDPQKLAAAERRRLDADLPSTPALTEPLSRDFVPTDAAPAEAVTSDFTPNLTPTDAVSRDAAPSHRVTRSSAAGRLKPAGRLKRMGRHAAAPADPAAPMISVTSASAGAPVVLANLVDPGALVGSASSVGSVASVGSVGPSGTSGAGLSYQRRSGETERGRLPAAAPVLRRPMTARWRPGADLTDEPRQSPPVLRGLARWPVTRSLWPPVSRQAIADGRGLDPGDRRDPSDLAAGPGALSPAAPSTAKDWLDGLFTLVRRNPLECAAVCILGVGGLIDPFPLWVLGALVVLVSRLWDTRDKLAAVAVPMAIALLGAVTLAGLNARSNSLSGYAHGVHTDGWDIIRVGAVLGAAYLAWRVRQGRRPRRGPPWQHSPRS